MPLDDIRSVLRAPDQMIRSQLIATHLARLEETLAETQRVVASLRELLEHPSPSVGHRPSSDTVHPGGRHHFHRRHRRFGRLVSGGNG